MSIRNSTIAFFVNGILFVFTVSDKSYKYAAIFGILCLWYLAQYLLAAVREHIDSKFKELQK